MSLRCDALVEAITSKPEVVKRMFVAIFKDLSDEELASALAEVQDGTFEHQIEEAFDS